MNLLFDLCNIPPLHHNPKVAVSQYHHSSLHREAEILEVFSVFLYLSFKRACCYSVDLIIGKLNSTALDARAVSSILLPLVFSP